MSITYNHAIGTLLLRFRQPLAPASINQLAGRGWRARHTALAPWRDAVAVHMREFVLGHLDVLLDVVEVEYDWPLTIKATLQFATNRRRDPHNFVGTTLKAMIDGLVVANFVPDDDPRYIVVEEPALEVSRNEKYATLAIVGVTLH